MHNMHFYSPKGGYIIGRHNEIRNFTVEILKEICSDVRPEPSLQPLNGEIPAYASAITSNKTKSHVSARGFWIREQTAFADIRVFNPLANCYRNQTLEESHRGSQNVKKRAYNERVIHVEHGSFTLLVFSCFGDMSREWVTCFSPAAELLAEKRKIPRSTASCWLNTRLNFSLLRQRVKIVRTWRLYSSKRVRYRNDMEREQCLIAYIYTTSLLHDINNILYTKG